MEQDNNKFPHNLKVGDKVVYEVRAWYGVRRSVEEVIRETKTRFRLSNGRELKKGEIWVMGRSSERGCILEPTEELMAELNEEIRRAKYRRIIDIEGQNLEALARNQLLTSTDLKQVIDKIEEIKQILNKQ